VVNTSNYLFCFIFIFFYLIKHSRYLIFRNGTTDVTRTLHFGIPTKQEKRAFTRVLQGHIAIDRAIFPKSTTGKL
jgi:hypothetical protein